MSLLSQTMFLDAYLSKTPEEKRRSDVIAYLASLDHLQQVAPTVSQNILNELRDQRRFLKLIASENFSSLSVQLAMGNLLTDKYCEGFPHHRFYAGCENVDAIESEAAELACSVFGTEHAYVQPHSGSDANLVAFWAILTEKIQNPALDGKRLDQLSNDEFEKVRQLLCNQKFLGLGLSSGGHLTHGFRQNVSAKMMKAISYEVDPKTHLLDYGQIAELARQEKPLILLVGYSAYSRLINFAKMREIADEVGAVLMVDMAHFAGLVAGKVFKGEYSPIGYAQMITSTTHKTLRGPRGGLILCSQEFAGAVDRGCPLVLGGPLPNVIAAKTVAFQEAGSPDFATYAQSIVDNAKALSEGLQKRSIDVITGGTDNHLVLVDLTSLGITGRIGEAALSDSGITSNRNMIPYDKNGAWYTSGIRLGTAALTTLGMGPDEMDEVAEIIVKVLHGTKAKIDPKTGQPSKAYRETPQAIVEESRERIQALLGDFPLYPEIEI